MAAGRERRTGAKGGGNLPALTYRAAMNRSTNSYL
jgi:hypothetical protein